MLSWSDKFIYESLGLAIKFKSMSKDLESSFLKKSPLDQEYRLESRQKLARLGEVLVLVNNKGHRIMAKEKTPTTAEDCKRDVLQAIERMRLNHPHLLKMHDYSATYENGQYNVKGYYELAEANLAAELEQRRLEHAPFSAEELRNLLVDVLEIVTFLKERKMIHGDIRPEYIMFDNQAQIYKLADRLGDPSPPNKVQARNIAKGRKLYLSPQLFHNLVHQARGAPDFQTIKLNPYLSEGYSLGLVMLEAALLEDVQDCFDMADGKINEAVLGERIEEFSARYLDRDVGLVRAIQDMVEMNEEDRPDLNLLLTGLKSTPQNSEDEEEDNYLFKEDPEQNKAASGIIQENPEDEEYSERYSPKRLKSSPQKNIFKEENEAIQASPNYVSVGSHGPPMGVTSQTTRVEGDVRVDVKVDLASKTSQRNYMSGAELHNSPQKTEVVISTQGGQTRVYTNDPKLEENIHWDNNLANLKAQRESLMQSLQSLKNTNLGGDISAISGIGHRAQAAGAYTESTINRTGNIFKEDESKGGITSGRGVMASARSGVDERDSKFLKHMAESEAAIEKMVTEAAKATTITVTTEKIPIKKSETVENSPARLVVTPPQFLVTETTTYFPPVPTVTRVQRGETLLDLQHRLASSSSQNIIRTTHEVQNPQVIRPLFPMNSHPVLPHPRELSPISVVRELTPTRIHDTHASTTSLHRNDTSSSLNIIRPHEISPRPAIYQNRTHGESTYTQIEASPSFTIVRDKQVNDENRPPLMYTPTRVYEDKRVTYTPSTTVIRDASPIQTHISRDYRVEHQPPLPTVTYVQNGSTTPYRTSQTFHSRPGTEVSYGQGYSSTSTSTTYIRNDAQPVINIDQLKARAEQLARMRDVSPPPTQIFGSSRPITTTIYPPHTTSVTVHQPVQEMRDSASYQSMHQSIHSTVRTSNHVFFPPAPPPPASSYHPMIVTNNPPRDLSPIVIRSRSPTPVKTVVSQPNHIETKVQTIIHPPVSHTTTTYTPLVPTISTPFTPVKRNVNYITQTPPPKVAASPSFATPPPASYQGQPNNPIKLEFNTLQQPQQSQNCPSSTVVINELPSGSFAPGSNNLMSGFPNFPSTQVSSFARSDRSPGPAFNPLQSSLNFNNVKSNQHQTIITNKGFAGEVSVNHIVQNENLKVDALYTKPQGENTPLHPSDQQSQVQLRPNLVLNRKRQNSAAHAQRL
jgi:hypothetical protein